MKVLVVGGGGREHALVWAIARSPRVERVYCAPGNAGIAAVAECVKISASDTDALLEFATAHDIGLTVVGPEGPLCSGIVDRFQEAGLRVFGPTKAAAEIEGSKVFAKNLMSRYQIPTATFHSFTQAADAQSYLRSLRDYPVVLKADGLAAGKGVIICEDLGEALVALDEIMEQKRFGEAGASVIVEECLKGEEASILALTDGQTIAVLESSQDHKAAFDGDTGPNTGGMGAYSPAPIVTERILRQIESQVLVPTIHGMAREKRPYRGLLYIGLMITKGGPRVLEYNCRFGDPETQPLLARLKTDLVDLIEMTIDGKLGDAVLEWDRRPAVCVVMAAGGYPGPYEKGKLVSGLEEAGEGDDLIVFHAGTERRGERFVTSGGRVLGVTALGDSISAARDRAYAACQTIHWEDVRFRKDIAAKAIDSGDA
jgi:phosphoribosylamine---glycine ligase